MQQHYAPQIGMQQQNVDYNRRNNSNNKRTPQKDVNSLKYGNLNYSKNLDV